MDTSNSREAQLRSRLGIPPAARRVLVIAESSHWDPNWLYTSAEYYSRYVRANLDMALAELAREPRRVYSLECVFFLRLYWEDRPACREQIRALVNEGRLRLTGSGVTTADTLLPGAESILRDWLLGQEWLRANGMHQEPQLAYFPDSFGYTQSLPSLLRAGGFDSTAVTRVDGMTFLGCDLDWPWKFPRPGSSAERLQKTERSLDFIWRDQAGSEVLCHWNAFTYGQGDLIAATGISRVYLVPLYRHNASDANVRAKIEAFVRQLAPLSRTPYLFCPIGYDFVPPIPNLVALLERYNRRHYPRSGTWVVNAGLDDYLALVNCYRDQLPVVTMDPNPYWTGFYSARPALKKLSFDLAGRLLLAETSAALAPDPAPEGDQQAIATAWWTSAVSNHHDYITGTGKDEVVAAEQKPWLEQAIRAVDAVLAGRPARSEAAEPASGLPVYQLRDGILTVQTSALRLELSEAAGGGILSATDGVGKPLLSRISNDVISYRDSGGLWRMGHEFPGGELTELGRASQNPTRFDIRAESGCLAVRWTAQAGSARLEQRLWLDGGTPGLHFQSQGTAPADQTLTLRFESGIQTAALWMDEPGGWLRRPVERHYQPTFWPFQSFASLGETPGSGLVFLRGMPGAGAYHPGGAFELVAQRNAAQETAFGFIHFPGMPVKGYEPESFCLDYGLLLDGPGGEVLERGAAVLGLGMAEPGPLQRWQALLRSAFALSPGARILALKAAEGRPGLILRLFHPGGKGRVVTVRPLCFGMLSARLCDARERELATLAVRDGQVELVMDGTVASLFLGLDG